MSVSEPAWDADLLRAPHEAADKRERVRRMFDAIAPRYRLVNALFSGGRDAAWRRRTVKIAEVGPGDDVLDVACGTGDLARAFLRVGPRSVVGCDFSHRMLCEATTTHSADRAGSSGDAIRWCEADALQLPWRACRFTVVSCAFGIRNFQDLEVGLGEMHRVLRPGGRCVILEFTRPTHRLARSLYEIYTGRVMPVLASLVSGDKTGAYRYLPRSVVSFVEPAVLCGMLERAGFVGVERSPLTFGAVTVYLARRGQP